MCRTNGPPFTWCEMRFVPHSCCRSRVTPVHLVIFRNALMVSISYPASFLATGGTLRKVIFHLLEVPDPFSSPSGTRVQRPRGWEVAATGLEMEPRVRLNSVMNGSIPLSLSREAGLRACLAAGKRSPAARGLLRMHSKPDLPPPPAKGVGSLQFRRMSSPNCSVIPTLACISGSSSSTHPPRPLPFSQPPSCPSSLPSFCSSHPSFHPVPASKHLAVLVVGGPTADSQSLLLPSKY